MMKKVVILHSDVAPDAAEDELDCLQQAEAIAEALRILGYEPVLLPFGLDLNKTITNVEIIKTAGCFQYCGNSSTPKAV